MARQADKGPCSQGAGQLVRWASGPQKGFVAITMVGCPSSMWEHCLGTLNQLDSPRHGATCDVTLHMRYDPTSASTLLNYDVAWKAPLHQIDHAAADPNAQMPNHIGVGRVQPTRQSIGHLSACSPDAGNSACVWACWASKAWTAYENKSQAGATQSLKVPKGLDSWLQHRIETA
jgi:hypothetical protein